MALEIVYRCVWVIFNTVFQMIIPDTGDIHFFSPASANILVQKLVSTFSQTAVFNQTVPKEK